MESKNTAAKVSELVFAFKNFILDTLGNSPDTFQYCPNFSESDFKMVLCFK